MSGRLRAIARALVPAVAFAATETDLAAQPAPPPVRPTVGVAFSGGGAKGCAHIGVLRVLEEMRIPVDYAAGTSMGSIIGGLYAAGFDPDELTAAITDVDWADALVDQPSRKDLIFRRKDDDLRYIPDLELGLGRGGLRYPTGLRSGQKLNYLLQVFTARVRTVSDFDDLPTPFRAVATDIATGRPVVLGEGDLGRALRASMAIPTLFTPVEIDGRLLVDGGVTNNVPVDVVREMGADVVIAIDVGSPLEEHKAAGRSFLSILGQTMALLTRGNMAERLAMADLVLHPPVGTFGTLDFDRGREIIEAGEAEARRMANQLRSYAVSEEEYPAWQAARRRAPDPVPVVTAVRVEGNARVPTERLATMIEVEPGRPYSAEAVRDDLSRMFGLGDFENIDVLLVPEGDGAAVVYRVREKPWGPTYLRLGLGFASDAEGSNELSLLVGVNRTWINRLGAEWKTEVELGSLRSIETELYQPLSYRNGWFVAPAASFGQTDLPLFDRGEQVAELEVTAAELALDLGYTFGRYGEVRLGVEWSPIEARRATGLPPGGFAELDGQTLRRAGVALTAVVDRMDSATLPKDGSIASLDAFYGLESLGGDDDYSRVALGGSRFGTRGRHTLFGGLHGGTSPGSDLPVYDRFTLGGFFALSAFERGELAGDNFGLAQLGYYYRMGKVLHLGGFAEVAGVAPRASDVADEPEWSATALAVADTELGPLYIGLSLSESGREALNIFFGRQF